jgi:hypothetical protein
MRKLRSHLTYANVISTLCLFLFLAGGSALAAGLAKNSVGSRQLKAKSVTTGKLANGAVNGSKVARNSLTGANINLSQLGTVPAAANATNATNSNTVGGHSAACPAATILIRGLCFDSQANPPAANVEAATEACAAKGGWLPGPMQLYSVRAQLNLGNGIGAAGHQYTDDFYGTVGGGSADRVVVLNGTGAREELLASQPSAYYCVYLLLR